MASSNSTLLKNLQLKSKGSHPKATTQKKSLEPFFKGFSKLSQSERFDRLVQMGALHPQDVKYLKKGGLKSTDLAEHCIENVIGYYQLPLGVAANFCIDGKDVVIPMAVEESSIIAAASKTARWVREHGHITTSVKGSGYFGQIHFSKIKDADKLRKLIAKQEKAWISRLNKEVCPAMFKRGGGVKSIIFRNTATNKKPDKSKGPYSKKGASDDAATLHVVVDTCNAMGANIINQVCEHLGRWIRESSGENITMCIVSNLSDLQITKAEVIMEGLDPGLSEKIEQASRFAEQDPYRAATNNKGVMNGIDAILLATGNDWRAVSAGVHAYAAKNGTYKSLTKWRVVKGKLHGVLEAPFMVGTLGGIINIHPTSQMCLKMMGVQNDSRALSRILAAVGLVQNLGALRALTTVGIIEGHMKLHIQNLTLGAGAKGWEVPIIQKHLEALLDFRKRISQSQAVEALKILREKTSDHLELLEKLRLKHKQQALNTLKKLSEGITKKTLSAKNPSNSQTKW